VGRRPTAFEAVFSVLVLAGGVVTFVCAFFALFDGQHWEALAFAAGGLSLALWSALWLPGARRQ
jgi:hypothetical protein